MPTTIPTPYDAEIAVYKNKPDAWLYVGHLEGMAEGYRQAKAEDAALLEALKAADEWSLNLHSHELDDLCPNSCVAQQVVAAIAQAKEGVH